MSTGPAPQRPRTTTADLPLEVKSRITAELTPRQAASLARACSDWQDAAEMHVWSRIAFEEGGPTEDISQLHDALILPDPPRWQIVVEALRARAALRPYVKELIAYPAPGIAAYVTEIIRLCSSSLETIVTDWGYRLYSDEDGADVGICVHSADTLLPRLTILVADVRMMPDENVYDMLLRTPALEQLGLIGLKSWCSAQSEEEASESARIPLRLERLERLNLWSTMMDSHVPMVALHEAAPRLSSVSVRPYQSEDISEAARSPFWRSETLRRLCFQGVRSRKNDEVLEAWRAAEVGTFLPNVTGLAFTAEVSVFKLCRSDRTDVQLGPGRFGPHDSLEILSVVPRQNEDLRPEYFLGSCPSDTVSGLPAPWLLEALRSMPKLTILAHEISLAGLHVPLSWWIENKYAAHIRSYTNGINTLYHVKYTGGGNRQKLYLLGPHHLSYLSGDMAWSEDLEWEDGWRVIYGPDLSDLVSYMGYPVPFALLQHVYQLSGQEMDWTMPNRELTLADEAWEVLRGWWEEVEREKVERGSGDVLEYLTEADIHDAESGTDPY